MSVSITKRDGQVVAGISREFTTENRKELKQKVLDELGRGERAFTIDFGQTAYVDSAALGVLVSLSKKIREGGGALRLANLSTELRALLAVTRLDTIFQIGDDGNESARPGSP